MAFSLDFPEVTEKQKEFLEETGALLKGHFLLTSGRHSEYYFQGMRLLENPHIACEIAKEIVSPIKIGVSTTIMSPAIGGIPWGMAIALQFPNSKAIFAERENGVMTLRRDFQLSEKENVILAEDVITTGGSIKEIHDLAVAAKANILGMVSILDRSGGKFDLGIPHYSWLKFEIESWAPEDCPLCKKGIYLVKPGSRLITIPLR